MGKYIKGKEDGCPCSSGEDLDNGEKAKLLEETETTSRDTMRRSPEKQQGQSEVSGASGIKEDGGGAPRCSWEKPLQEGCFAVTVLRSRRREALFICAFIVAAFGTASHPSNTFGECLPNAGRETHRHSAV